MKKKLLIGILIFIALGGLIVFMTRQQDSVIEQIETVYMKDGLIQAYDRNDAQLLSESLGQYMMYLLEIGDAQRFAEQVDILRKQFLVTSEEVDFIKWELTPKTATNAIVDDFRISNALIAAAKRFDEPTYLQLSRRIDNGIVEHMKVSGVPIDFYDWNLKMQTNELRLNYLDATALKRLNLVEPVQEVLQAAPRSGPFFHEIYLPEDKQYKMADKKEVNMIDQALIAIVSEELTGKQDEAFYAFVYQEMGKGKLYARYDRSTAAPRSDDESSSVYALLLPYVSKDIQRKMTERLNQIDLTNAKTTHVFDFLNEAIMQVQTSTQK
ncbi:glycoside transferase [Exiguobacterium artemiae]